VHPVRSLHVPGDLAASSGAAEAPAAVVGRTLREELPLPGEPADGWAGLETSEEAPAASHGGHDHAR
jgi:hypothetical protein